MRHEFEAAQKQVERDPVAGREAMQAFLQQRGNSALADDAALELAKLDRKERKVAQAKLRIAWLLRTHPRGDRVEAAKLLLAQIDGGRGEFSKAYKAASRVDFEALRRDEQRAALRLLTNFDMWRENARAELYWRAKWHTLADQAQEKSEQEARIRVLLSGPLVDEDFQDLAESVAELPLADPLAIHAVERALAKGDAAAAERSLHWLQERSLSEDASAMVARLETELREIRNETALRALPPPLEELGLPEGARRTPVKATLGVVLPLSGAWQQYGEESLAGILLAAGIFDSSAKAASQLADNGAGNAGSSDAESAIQLIVRDSAGDPARAVQAVREISAMEDVVAIIGPLHFKEVQAAAGEAELDAVPLLTLTSREEVARKRGEVFRFGMTKSSRVEALAERVGKNPGFRRAAILYPRDRYGRSLKRLFWKAAEAHGAEVVGVASYEPGATDFASAIRSLAGYTLLTEEEKKLLKEREKRRYRARRLPVEEAVEVREALDVLTTLGGTPLPPRIDFDAVFIADSYEKVVLIAPQLAFHDITGIRLLGAGGWNDPKLVRLGGQHVRGAIFAESFAEDYPHPLVREFSARYRQEFERSPSQFSAQAFDVVNLVLDLLSKGAASRPELAQMLLHAGDYPGVSGVMRMRADGNAWKRPFLLQVRWGRIEPLR